MYPKDASHKKLILQFILTMVFALFFGCQNPNEPTLKDTPSGDGTSKSSLAKKSNSLNNTSDHSESDHNGDDHDEDDNDDGGGDHDGDDHDSGDHEGEDNDDGGGDHDDDDDHGGSGGGGGTQCDSVVTLWAGKSINSGTVKVTNTSTTVQVKYTTTGSWKIYETHLDISTQQFTQRGAPGQYQYSSTNPSGVTTYTYSIPKTWAAGTKIYFRAHAVVKKAGCSETAFGGKVIIPERGSWFATFCYCIKAGVPTPTYQISGYTFVDANSNGIKDVGESTLANVSVSLNTGATVVSNTNGLYNFAGLNAGTYTVTGGGVAGYNQTTTPVSVTIVNANGSANFGYKLIPPPPTYQISGVVYSDANISGTKDVGEVGIQNVSVALSNGATTITDANGFYSFTGLLSNTYVVSTTTPSGYNATTSQNVTVVIGIANATVHFGYFNGVIPLKALQDNRAR